MVHEAILNTLSLANIISSGGLALKNIDIKRHTNDLVEPMGFEFTSDMETKEFCGAARPSKVLKGKGGNS